MVNIPILADRQGTSLKLYFSSNRLPNLLFSKALDLAPDQLFPLINRDNIITGPNNTDYNIYMSSPTYSAPLMPSLDRWVIPMQWNE